ncbi:hypothetical protein D7Z54_18815 [Salibacterium salarium]|uniref:Intracellular proteinase inhibitor n=1 Tax=Salibacterium salarium TaxID=284579 RepID=A0A3R9QJJ7_9BACI|nr:hypothetical protein [Salibacterium salarium]RSL31849.1 hypothetical protein D7Z54_18815 [Salibacterium salarium]
MKRLILLLILLLSVAGCSDDEEEETADIVFGEVVEDNEIEAKNVFERGEKVNFLLESKSNLEMEEVSIQLNGMNPNSGEWEKITSNTLETNPDSKQIMNGLEGSIFEQLGSGTYQLEIKLKDETVKGDFIVEEKE